VESPEPVTGGGDTDVGVTGGQAFHRVWDGVRDPRSILTAHETKLQSSDLAYLNGSTIVALSRGQSAGQTCRALSITEQTYYRWRNEYGGLKGDQVKRLKELERENTRLTRAVADHAAQPTGTAQ
jgi:hypothetical protein